MGLVRAATRENMHPADQFEAFKKLAEERGFGAEEIAARFGVTPHVVRQRLRLGAVSPKLMQVYRDGDLALDQLMAFAITEDHARQETAYERLSHNRDASTIRRMLTEANVAATDRRAIFVGAEAYTEAGGTILRDLFTEDRGGYFEDVALLDLLVMAKLGREANALMEADGWKWVQVFLDFPHSHGLRRTYPQTVELSAGDQTALDAARGEFDSLTAQHESAEELPDEVDARFGELEAEIERLEAKRQAYGSLVGLAQSSASDSGGWHAIAASTARQRKALDVRSPARPSRSRRVSRAVLFGIASDGMTKVRRQRPTLSPRKTVSDNPAIEGQGDCDQHGNAVVFCECRCCLSYS